MNSQIRLATIIGATSWGTTLGILLANQGIETKLIVRSKQEEDLLNSSKENLGRLAGHPFPINLTASADMKDSLKDADLIVIACPSHSYRANIQKIDYSSIKFYFQFCY